MNVVITHFEFEIVGVFSFVFMSLNFRNHKEQESHVKAGDLPSNLDTVEEEPEGILCLSL